MPAVAYQFASPRVATLPLGPFTGMRDAVDPTSTRQDLARLLRNVYPRDPGQMSGVVGRPGFDQMGAQLGSGGDVQFLGQLTTLAGVEYTVAIVGGKFYTLNWSTETWTEVVTAANFATASITVSPTARFYATTFNNTMVFTDGTNNPWTWTGASGAGGLTSLTNAPVAFGPPCVYYGKLFFIKSTERSTFVWSEENQANTGYEAGGYNNAWTLGQTDANRLTCLLGANEALYVFREYSTSQIVGEVTTNFSSTGTREAVSSTIGTKAPGSVFFDGSDILFADAIGRPHVIKPGSEPIPIWQDFDQTIRLMDTTKFHEIEGCWNPVLELATFAYEEQGATERSKQLCYRSTGVEIPQAACIFDGYSFTRIGTVKNGDGDLRIMHGSTDGYVYDHGTPYGSVWNDGLNAGDAAIEHEIRTNLVSYSETTESHFTRADFIITAYSDTSITVRAETPRDTSDELTVSFTGGFSVWDVGVWDTAEWASVEVQHGAVGLNSFGHYCGIIFTHASGSQQFQFVSGVIYGRPFSRYPALL